MAPESEAGNSPAVRATRGRRWGFRIAASVTALLALALADIGLRLAGLVPPQDPLLFHIDTYVGDFSPFVESGDGWLSIRPDWEKRDETYRITEGSRQGRLFIHPGFRPCRFSKKKPPNTIRIFALGGSTTFGQWVGAERAFPALIRERLQAAVPERRVEVINLGCPGLESTRVAILHRAVLDLDPDLVLVYSGHNEMLLGEDLATPAGGMMNAVRAGLLRTSTIAAWLNHDASGYRKSREYEILSEEAAALEAGKILSYVEQPEGERYHPLSEDYRRNRATEYGRNVREMAAAAERNGIPTLFVLPPANLLFAPRKSAHREMPARVAEFDALLERAQRAFQQGRYDEALGLADRAIAISPDFAMARFVRGVTLMELGRSEDAVAELGAAIELDVQSDRITPLLQSTLLDAVAEAGAPLVDLRPSFERDPGRASAKRLFVDHCHPTAYGHGLVAGAILPSILAALDLPGERDRPPGAPASRTGGEAPGTVP